LKKKQPKFFYESGGLPVKAALPQIHKSLFAAFSSEKAALTLTGAR
jgi:hypothetical protein